MSFEITAKAFDHLKEAISILHDNDNGICFDCQSEDECEEGCSIAEMVEFINNWQGGVQG